MTANGRKAMDLNKNQTCRDLLGQRKAYEEKKLCHQCLGKQETSCYDESKPAVDDKHSKKWLHAQTYPHNVTQL